MYTLEFLRTVLNVNYMLRLGVLLTSLLAMQLPGFLPSTCGAQPLRTFVHKIKSNAQARRADSTRPGGLKIFTKGSRTNTASPSLNKLPSRSPSLNGVCLPGGPCP